MRAAIKVIIESCRANKVPRKDLYLDPALFRQLIEDVRKDYNGNIRERFSYDDPAGTYCIWAYGVRVYPRGYSYIVVGE